MRRVLAVAVTAGLGVFGLASDGAWATTARGAAPVEVTTRAVDEAGISLAYPSKWPELTEYDWSSTKEIRQTLAAMTPAVADLMAIDLNDSPREIARYLRQMGLRTSFRAISEEDGNNVAIQIWRNQQWWTDLDEYRAFAHASAASSKRGKVLSTAQTSVGDRDAMTHLEQYRLQGHDVVFAHAEIRGDHREVITVDVLVDKNQRDLAESILASLQTI